MDSLSDTKGIKHAFYLCNAKVIFLQTNNTPVTVLSNTGRISDDEDY